MSAERVSTPSVTGLEESAEDLYENAPCGYLSTLEDGTIIRVNQTFLRWSGYSRADLVGKMRFQDLLTAGGRIYHETHFAPMLRMQGWVREIAVEIKASEGHLMPVLVNSIYIRGEGDRPSVVRTMVFGATERRQYEQELLREQKRARESEGEARILAQTLQESLIPPELPEVYGLDLAGAYRPAGTGDTVGGDFYDVFETTFGDWALVVGDVSGKGAEAARVTAAARYTLRAAAMRSSRPSTVLTEVNHALISQKAERFCTIVCARVSVRNNGVAMTVASGGHPLPIVVPANGTARSVGRPGALLGAFPEVAVEDEEIALGLGDSVVLYTDGVTEARREDGRFFGEARLLELAETAVTSAAELCSAVSDAVVEFQGGLPRDDIAVLVLRVSPTAGRPA